MHGTVLIFLHLQNSIILAPGPGAIPPPPPSQVASMSVSEGSSMSNASG